MKVVKRDGRVDEFNEDKIKNAVLRAMNSVYEDPRNERDARLVAREVVKRIEGQGVDEITVEEIQDLVEDTLMDLGFKKAARAYIVYREERKKIRGAKKIIGVEDDLKLTMNAVRVLEARYLLKDEQGNIIETPKQMFRRVARYIALVEILYEEDIYDREGNQEPKDPDTVDRPDNLSQW